MANPAKRYDEVVMIEQRADDGMVDLAEMEITLVAVMLVTV